MAVPSLMFTEGQVDMALALQQAIENKTLPKRPPSARGRAPAERGDATHTNAMFGLRSRGAEDEDSDDETVHKDAEDLCPFLAGSAAVALRARRKAEEQVKDLVPSLPASRPSTACSPKRPTQQHRHLRLADAA